MESLRSLTAALAELPRFAPSAGFSEAVMARVVVHQRAWLLERIADWMPTTRGGWGLFSLLSLIPILSALNAVVWLDARFPGVTTGGALRWAVENGRSAGWALVSDLTVWVLSTPLPQWWEMFLSRAETVGGDLLVVSAVAFATMVPVSAWLLMHLLRTPLENRSHA